MRKAENMSFSGDVRTQIAGIIPGPAHCRLAELAVLLGRAACPVRFFYLDPGYGPAA